MDSDIDRLQEIVAQNDRDVALLRFRLLQLQHTNDQLVSALHELATLAAQRRRPTEDESPADRS